jgi:hypothetical protein
MLPPTRSLPPSAAEDEEGSAVIGGYRTFSPHISVRDGATVPLNVSLPMENPR